MDEHAVSSAPTDDDSSHYWQDPGPKVRWWNENGFLFERKTLRDVLENIRAEGMLLPTTNSSDYPNWLPAQAFLYWFLATCGEAPAREAVEMAVYQFGISEHVLRAARKKLGIIAYKQTGERHGCWWWKRPPGLRDAQDLCAFDRRWKRYYGPPLIVISH